MSDSKLRKFESVPAGIWRCPRCGIQIATEVDMTCPPACGNHKGGKFAIMELVTKKTKAKQG